MKLKTVLVTMICSIFIMCGTAFATEEVNPFLNWLILKTGTIYILFYLKTAALIFILILLARYLSKSQKKLEESTSNTL